LESANEIGGRLKSFEFQGRRFEEGANWVTGLNNNPIWEMAQKIGLKGVMDD
jgi:polyamine oxidase